VSVPDGGARGVIVSQGGAFGGWTLYAHEGLPAYCYNLFGLQRFKVYGANPIPAGDHQVRLEFAYDGGGLAKGGTASLFLDGQKVGEGRVDGTVPMAFSADETTDVGSDTATPVTDDIAEGGTEWNGRVHWVELAIGDDAADSDHLISPEERYRIAMARQ
jgi:arylsulfatase